MDKIVGL